MTKKNIYSARIYYEHTIIFANKNRKRDNFNRFWTQSMYRVAVDGGINFLSDLDKGC